MSSDASAPLAQRVSDFIREEIIPIEERELGLIHTRADGDRIARRDLGLREDLLARQEDIGIPAEFAERMAAGLEHWVEGGQAGRLSWAIMVFRKQAA